MLKLPAWALVAMSPILLASCLTNQDDDTVCFTVCQDQGGTQVCKTHCDPGPSGAGGAATGGTTASVSVSVSVGTGTGVGGASSTSGTSTSSTTSSGGVTSSSTGSGGDPCEDGAQGPGEVGIDCGGGCPPCWSEISDTVSGGDVGVSAGHWGVSTTGQPTQNQNTQFSANYRLQGGLVGAMGSLP